MKKLGHPADCNHKRNNSGKKRDNKIKNERGPTNPQQKEDYENGCLFKINFQYPNHHRNIKDSTPGLNWDSKHRIN